MARNILAFVVGTGTKSLISIMLNIAWYLACLATWPNTFNAPASTFPWWFFCGLLLITAVSGTAAGLIVVAIATKPARRFVIVIAVALVVSTFILTESGAIAIWIPVWVGHLRRIVLCTSFWYSARWLGLRLARQREQVERGGRIAW